MLQGNGKVVATTRTSGSKAAGDTGHDRSHATSGNPDGNALPPPQCFAKANEKAAGRKGQPNGGGSPAGDHGERLGIWDAVAKAAGGAGQGKTELHSIAAPDLEPLSDGDLDPRFVRSPWMRLSVLTVDADAQRTLATKVRTPGILTVGDAGRNHAGWS